jgi:hypothetical protein
MRLTEQASILKICQNVSNRRSGNPVLFVAREGARAYRSTGKEVRSHYIAENLPGTYF